VKENNNIEQFDEIFKQQLGNASTPVPPGLWEGISSSVGSGAGAASVAVKTALWMKAIVAVSVIGVVSAVTYGVLSQKEPEAVTVPVPPVETQKTETEKVDNNPVISGTQTMPAQPEVKETQPVSRPVARKGSQKHKKESTEWNNVSQWELQGKNRPKIQFYEIKDEVSNTYLSKMNDNVVPGFDSAKMIKKAEEEKTTEIPYVPEQQAIAHFVDSSFIYIPNVVTPNGDGVNDEYLIDIKGEEFVQIIIYNSRSVKVFETKNKNTAWDCKMPNGEIAPEGNYVVKVIYKFKNKSKKTSITPLKLIK
jgi:gliding motility-associated-like protein